MFEIDHNATLDVVAADVLVPLWRVANGLLGHHIDLFEQCPRPDCATVPTFVGVDIGPVVLGFEGDDHDFVVTLVVREHGRLGVLEVLFRDSCVGRELATLSKGDILAALEEGEAVVREGVREFVEELSKVLDFQAYSVEEIFAEKLRAIYQRGAARDYYDLYQLLETDSVTIDFADMGPAFDAKCKRDGLTVDLNDGLPAEQEETIRHQWETTLPDLTGDPPAFEMVWNRLDTAITQQGSS
ncbi:nucleotidyl transferase AbiEii/AbiGii toxin family protein [Halorubrum sp. RMP-47]|uniref:nucleotidyl transferase AbiEii/AbiGii toxin family protein n=1 Tax=Halorubrum miltondacostae TaxID=3076378 RepID=UPI0035277C02